MHRKRFYATAELKQSRIAKGLSRQEMTGILRVLLGKKISLAAYRKWEQGVNSVKLDDALTICRELEREFNELWSAR